MLQGLELPASDPRLPVRRSAYEVPTTLSCRAPGVGEGRTMAVPGLRLVREKHKGPPLVTGRTCRWALSSEGPRVWGGRDGVYRMIMTTA